MTALTAQNISTLIPDILEQAGMSEAAVSYFGGPLEPSMVGRNLSRVEVSRWRPRNAPSKTCYIPYEGEANAIRVTCLTTSTVKYELRTAF